MNTSTYPLRSLPYAFIVSLRGKAPFWTSLLWVGRSGNMRALNISYQEAMSAFQRALHRQRAHRLRLSLRQNRDAIGECIGKHASPEQSEN